MEYLNYIINMNNKENKYYSYSQLSTYVNCPQRYKLLYIDKIKKTNESVEAFIGKIAHEVLEWLYKKNKSDLTYVAFDQIINKYNQIWKERIHKKIFLAWIKIKFKRNKRLYNLNWFKNKGLECLRQYYNHNGPNFSEVNILGIEKQINTKIGEYYFRGYIDRLDESKGNIIINDYKTGKVKTKKQLLSDLQLIIYLLAVKEKYVDKDIKLRWYFLDKNYTVVEVDYKNINKESRLKKFKNTIINISNDIKQSTINDNFPSKESTLCEWCYLWKECSTKVGKNPSINL